jgi:hypothetical protein
VYAIEAVERLRGRGYDARRLVDGLPDWRRAGRPVAIGAESTLLVRGKRRRSSSTRSRRKAS